jgi:hypothetical protein
MNFVDRDDIGKNLDDIIEASLTQKKILGYLSRAIRNALRFLNKEDMFLN